MGNELTIEQIAEQQKWEEDVAMFNTGLQSLIQKTQVTIVPKLIRTEDGSRTVLKLQRLATTPQPEEPAEKPAKAKKNAKAKK